MSLPVPSDREILREPMPDALMVPAFFRLPDVLRITGLSRPTLYRRIAAASFPPPVRLGGRTCGWARTELLSWISDPEGYRAPRSPTNRLQRIPNRPHSHGA
jgi:predicted DNA-binding transcriptional regulator AlpA